MFYQDDGSIRLGLPRRLSLDPEAQRLDGSNPANWVAWGVPWQHLAWPPQGDVFLVTQAVSDDARDLWLVKLDGSPPDRVAQMVDDYAWSPDGQHIVFTRFSYPGSREFRVFLVRRDGRGEKELVRLEGPDFPGLSNEGVWYSREGVLWLAPYDSTPPRRVVPLPEMAAMPGLSRWGAGVLIRPSPANPTGMVSTRIAYTCGADLCLQDLDGQKWTKVKVAARDLSWSPDGSWLAAVEWDYGDKPARLVLVRRDGGIERRLPLSPNGPVAAPQWTPDGSRLFIQTFPFGGRRILVVEMGTGASLDLSQPRWDAWFALLPDGRRLLLSNGRGGFWISELVLPFLLPTITPASKEVPAEQEEKVNPPPWPKDAGTQMALDAAAPERRVEFPPFPNVQPMSLPFYGK